MFIKLTLANSPANSPARILYLDTDEHIICHMERGEATTTIHTRRVGMDDRQGNFTVEETPADILRQAGVEVPLLDDPARRVKFEREVNRGRYISDCELTVNLREALVKADITTLGDLAECTEEDLLGIKGIGSIAIERIKHMLRVCHLLLVEDDDKDNVLIASRQAGYKDSV